MTESDPFAGLADVLRNMGVPDGEIQAAGRNSPRGLVSLLVDRIFIPGTERLTRLEVAERVGIDLDEAALFWRALGFPDQSDEDAVFTEVDVEVLHRVVEVISSGTVDRDLALQMTRVIGRSAAQVAAALVDIVRRNATESGRVSELPQVLATTPTLIGDVKR